MASTRSDTKREIQIDVHQAKGDAIWPMKLGLNETSCERSDIGLARGRDWQRGAATADEQGPGAMRVWKGKNDRRFGVELGFWELGTSLQ